MNVKTTTVRDIKHKTRGPSVVLKGGSDDGRIVRDVRYPTIETPYSIYKKTSDITESGYTIYRYAGRKHP